MNNKSNFAVTIACVCASVLSCSDLIILFVGLCTSYLQHCLLRNCVWSRLWSQPYFHTLFSPWWLWWGNMISIIACWRECNLDLEAWLKVFHLQNTTWLNQIIYPFYVTRYWWSLCYVQSGCLIVSYCYTLTQYFCSVSVAKNTPN